MRSMQSLLAPYSPYLYALLRIVAGLLFAQHGVQKLFGWLGGTQMPLASQMGVAGIVETFGGLAIALGLFTSPVAFIASGQMAVAYFQSHLPRGVLADPERRRAGGLELLPLPLHRLARLGEVERAVAVAVAVTSAGGQAFG